MTFRNLSLGQKILLFSLYSLIILMMIFSVGATKNIGKTGYDKCIQKQCDERGEESCQKFRVVNNCCLGAGGKLVQTQQGLDCSFI